MIVSKKHQATWEITELTNGLDCCLWWDAAIGFFFVDTMAPNGPRSIWTHPLDDPEWLSTVPQGMDPLAYVYKLWADQVCEKARE